MNRRAFIVGLSVGTLVSIGGLIQAKEPPKPKPKPIIPPPPKDFPHPEPGKPEPKKKRPWWSFHWNGKEFHFGIGGDK